MIRPTKQTCNKQVQKFTNTSYDMLLELYNNTGFFKDLYEALNPAHYTDFSGGLNGWQATAGTGDLIQLGNFALSTGGDFYNDNLDISAEENGNITLTFEIDTVGTFVGDVEITYEAGTVLYSGIVSPVGGVGAINLNLEQEPTHVGKITGLRFILGSSASDIFKIYKIIVGKPLLSINNLSNVDAQILDINNRLNALDNSTNNNDSRLNALELMPEIRLLPASLPEDVERFEITGLKREDLTKKILVKNDVIEVVNTDGSSYFLYHIGDNVFEYKGRLILTDGSIIESVDDIRAQDGDYQEFQFTRSSSTPTLDPSSNNPAGFSINPPDAAGHLWMIVAKKTAEGNLIGVWSNPVRISGLDGMDGSDGNDGNDGNDGDVIAAVSVFLTNESYTAPSEPDGSNPNLGGGNGEFALYVGTTRVTSGLSFSGTQTKNGLTLTIHPTSGTYSLSGTNWSSDLEFFDLTVTYLGNTYTKRYTVNKSRSGGGGTAGAGFFFLEVSQNTQTGSLLQQTLNNAILTKAERVATQGDSFFVTWLDGTQGYVYNGSSWVTSAVTINGSIIASGTIAGDKLVANALYGKRQLISSNTHVWVTDPTGVELPSDMLVWYGSTDFSAANRTRANGIFWIDRDGNYSKDYQKQYSSVNFVYSGTETTTVTLPNIKGLVEGRVTGRLNTFVAGAAGDFPEDARLELRILRNGVFQTQQQLELVKRLAPFGGYLVDGTNFQYIIQSPVVNFIFFIDPAQNTGAYQSDSVYTLEVRIIGGNSQSVYPSHFSQFRLVVEENR